MAREEATAAARAAAAEAVVRARAAEGRAAAAAMAAAEAEAEAEAEVKIESGEGHSWYSRCRGRTGSTPIRVRHRRRSCPQTIRMIQCIGSRRSPGGPEVKHGGHSQCSRFPNCNQKSVRPGRRRRNFRHWLYSHSEGYRTDWCTSQEQEQEQEQVEVEVEVEVEASAAEAGSPAAEEKGRPKP